MEIREHKYEPRFDSTRHEIENWRHYFLDRMFSEYFKNIPEEYKHRLSSYFLAIPSECFGDPMKEWYTCISVLLIHLEDCK
jgi:hypothetical protein